MPETDSITELRQRRGGGRVQGRKAEAEAAAAEQRGANGDVAEATFTWEEVAKHNTAESCWMAIHDTVYDVTPWLASHPGGQEVLLLAAGRDVTNAFESYHPFTDKPSQILGKFAIGKLVTHEFPPYKSDDESGLYKELCTVVGDYFRENKVDPKHPWAGMWRMALVMLVASVCYWASWVAEDVPFAVRVLTASIFGICQVLPLLHVMHDSSHFAFGWNETWWRIGGRFFMDFYAGANMTSWHNQHTIGHHIYTNVVMADPDLPTELEGDVRRLVPRQKYASFYRFQHLYLPLAYGVLGMKFRFQDVFETYGGRHNGPVRVNPISMWGWVELWLSKAVWAFYRIYLPLAVWNATPAAQFWILFFIAELWSGWYLAFNFQVSHVSTECDYPLGDKDGKSIADEWAVSQIKSSVDYAHGNTLITFLAGALNYQVTHHLFPTVSQYHYPAIAPLIMDVCKKHNVHYPILPSFAAAFRSHLTHLYRLGQQGIPAEVHMG